ncbi:U-box domain-containing protein [Thalictrum thalictroides]|uniref:U-box domain-containing protein n=1 Tax=Thalictrum thalictroides TaxID=46969 RepID=A0A7J6W7F5_THATH|nr:U-box domain-containing protein [Thalictrum thalictroides]
MKSKIDGVDEEQSSKQQPNLCKVIGLVSSLLSLSYSVKVFHVKWQLIRSKLEELNSSLTSAENCDFSDNSTIWELLPAISVTVNDCHDLANRCVNLSYSGKLLMQSDLDVIMSKFEVHLKSLAEIYNAGVLSQGHMIVVSKPGIGACRDDMKFYIMDLITRMKIGDPVMKSQALIALNEVVQDDDRYVKIVVESEDLIGLLVNFLQMAETGTQEESLKVVIVIAEFSAYRNVLVGAGIVAPLIQVLESGTELGKERAAIGLQKLTENSNNAWSISAQGGVTALIRICSSSDSREELIGAACGILKNLVGVEEIKKFMVEAGAISTFIKLMNSKAEASKINAIEFLQIMASGSESILQTVIRGGGIYSLDQVLDPKASFSSKTREIAFRAIDTFCFSSRSSLITLLGYGFLDQLLFFLSSCEVSIQELAVKATFRLCNTSEDIIKAMGDKDFMPELMQLLDARSFEVQDMAAEALASMLCVPRNRRKFVHEDVNVGRILQLLEPGEGRSSNKRFLLSIIMSLASCHSGRRKITNSIYLKNVEKLAEADVLDAKRIIKKLSTNRFRSILSMIWNS